jgi:membrane protein
MAVTSPKILEAGGTEVATAAGGARRYRKPLTAFRWCDIKALLSESVAEWNRHNGPRLGAALAFYTLLSFAPLLLVAVGIAGLVFGREAAQSQIVWQMQDLVGPSGAQAIKAVLEGARNTTHGILATLLGLLTLLFGASGVLIELRDALNTIWEVPPAQRTGLQNIAVLIKERIFSFALVLAVGFLLLVSLALNACISALGAFSAHAFPLSAAILHIANTLLSFTVVTGLFAAIYRIMPDARIEWRDVALGAGVTSLLFTVGKLLIGLYLGNAGFASTYGAAASIVLLIVWVYYSGQIFFLGAEFTKVFADRYGSQPTRHPEAMVIEKTSPHPTSAEELKIITPSEFR